MNDLDWLTVRELSERVRAARTDAEEVGIPLERYDAGLSVVEAEYLLRLVREFRVSEVDA